MNTNESDKGMKVLAVSGTVDETMDRLEVVRRISR